MVDNPRFPHTVEITRDYNRLTPFDEAYSKIVHVGECRNYLNGKQSYSSKVVSSDYVIASPTITKEVKPGDYVKVTEKYRVVTGTVVLRVDSNFGTNIYWNADGN